MSSTIKCQFCDKRYSILRPGYMTRHMFEKHSDRISEPLPGHHGVCGHGTATGDDKMTDRDLQRYNGPAHLVSAGASDSDTEYPSENLSGPLYESSDDDASSSDSEFEDEKFATEMYPYAGTPLGDAKLPIAESQILQQPFLPFLNDMNYLLACWLVQNKHSKSSINNFFNDGLHKLRKTADIYGPGTVYKQLSFSSGGTLWKRVKSMNETLPPWQLGEVEINGSKTQFFV
jgi:hypothetical protein